MQNVVAHIVVDSETVGVGPGRNSATRRGHARYPPPTTLSLTESLIDHTFSFLCRNTPAGFSVFFLPRLTDACENLESTQRMIGCFRNYILGLSDFFEAAANGQTDQVKRLLNADPQLIFATDLVRPLTLPIRHTLSSPSDCVSLS